MLLILAQKLVFFNQFVKINLCPRGVMDNISVFGTEDRGSSPLEGIKTGFL